MKVLCYCLLAAVHNLTCEIGGFRVRWLVSSLQYFYHVVVFLVWERLASLYHHPVTLPTLLTLIVSKELLTLSNVLKYNGRINVPCKKLYYYADTCIHHHCSTVPCTTEAPQLKHATVYHGIFNFVKHNRTFKTWGCRNSLVTSTLAVFCIFVPTTLPMNSDIASPAHVHVLF